MTNPSEKSGSRRGRSTWWQLVLLMWKNLVLRRRHWLLTFFEILLPTALFSIVLFIRLIPGSNFIPEHINATTIFETDSEMRLKEYACSNYGKWINKTNYCFTMPNMRDLQIYYGPYGGFTNSVATHVANELNIPKDALTPVFTNEEMDSLVLQSYYTANITPYYIGLFFNDLDDVDSAPHDLKYDLRLTGTWMTASKYPFLEAAGPANSTFRYLNQGFALIQSLVDRFFISQITGNDTYSDYKVEVQKYPYPSYYNDFGISQLYGSFLPSDVVLSFVLLSPSLIKSIVYEKETGVRELMRLMGMSRWLVWVGWFLHALVVVVVVVTIITIMITVGLHSKGAYIPPILNYSNPFIVWIFLALYGISSITFCLTISTFFSRPTLATTLGVLIWLFSYYIPNSIIYLRYERMSLAPKVLYCLIPNMAMTIGFRVIEMFEGRAVGVQWSNMWETGNPRDQVTPGLLMIMMVVDSVIYCILIWYVDQVSPGTYGVALPWYFPFQKSYWCGSGPAKEAPRAMNDALDPDTRQNFEDEPVGLTPGIIIRNLRKEFKSLGRKVKVAVEDVSMTCYEGQCTVLLGHNGAGKTTTMSILTGVFAPSGGYAEVGGWDIATNLKEAREEVGLCPQHNMLFVDLTVMQHLLFFGRLKGMTTAASRAEGMVILKKLDLDQKIDVFGDQLSGGMKRKLCLAISLIGDSKVVILDEPSSGLDPESRRWVWDVVQGERGRRTILVTTHHMEEADVLGDRVAIMASGRVVCAGSTLFLKNKFGDGYTLEMMVTEDFSLEAITAEVTSHIPSAALHNNQGGEVTFKLPPITAMFAPLLESLTRRKEELGVRHLGLSLTTMERVFIGVSEVMEKSEQNSKACETKVENGGADNNMKGFLENGLTNSLQNGLTYSSQQQLYTSQTLMKERLRGYRLLLQRIKAFFIKRIIYSKRKWPLLITQGLIPVAVTLSCLLVDQTLDVFTSQEPPLVLDLSIFPYTTSFVRADPPLQYLAEQYTSLFTDPHEVSIVTNMTDSLLTAAEDDLPTYRENDICFSKYTRAEFTGDKEDVTMRILMQTIPYHTLGIGTSLVTNALLKAATNSTHTITTTNWPLPPDNTWKFHSEFSTSSFVYSNVMPLALAFLSASFLVFPLQERETKTKQVQVMTGAPVWALWSTTFIWDFATYMISVVLIFICFLALDPHGYFTKGEASGALIVMLVMYGWASIPMAYVFSFPFQTAASGFAVLALVNIVAGQLMTVIVWGLRAADVAGLTTASDIIYWVTSVIPSFPVSMAFSHVVRVSVHNDKCNQFNETVTKDLCKTLSLFAPTNDFMECCLYDDPPVCSLYGNKTCFSTWSYFRFENPGLAPDLLTLFVNGIIFLAIIVFLEAGGGIILRRVWRRITCRTLKIQPHVGQEGLQEVDEDVAAESDAVASLMTSAADNSGITSEGSMDTTLIASKLSKVYEGSLIPAVNSISFRVARGECLGLLGVNGAGKTTTFKMLTGDEVPTSGDAVIDGLSLNRERNKFVQNIGYCPQFDAFLGDLTGVEMLQLMGRLRGMTEVRLEEIISSLIPLVGLTECAKRPSSTYSGGNRRKLSTAMALVGSPPLVFLDEPTSGVDPVSRRRVWTAVRQAVINGQSVVLTSHSMEECEALCSRIIIMSRGTLRCVGTTGHLKAKFGQGYSLQVKLRTHGFTPGEQTEDEHVYDTKVSELKNIISRHLPGSTLTDQHKGMLAYRIPSNVPWGTLFSVMETVKAGRDPSATEAERPYSSPASPSIVEVYAASDTSLEQVFLSFAREAALEQASDVAGNGDNVFDASCDHTAIQMYESSASRSSSSSSSNSIPGADLVTEL
ncbi:LOW QUALITY PROTEIN: phospholipid-transporting ATPase ABCA3 [Procambarus clarkii]|uniref:LOW QUALITY PROTEIN: phospholipid-transporting ATPase ABCA3 n=1 Tax=Procambarus clarkii TaxID=6728 RepID=UPI0037428376